MRITTLMPGVLLVLLVCTSVLAQSSAFNFQGRLNDGSSPANGHYDLQFRLYDAITGGTRIGPVLSRPDSVLINGVFSTTLNFGASAFAAGADRYLEISVRPAGSTDAYVVLGARQQLLSVPFAVKAILADFSDHANTADVAATAQDASALGGVSAAGYARLNFLNTGNFQTSGNTGLGTVAPNTRLTLSGGPSWTSQTWTASMNLQNGSAIGWEANGSGQRFGIGQTNTGLHFFRTISGFGSTLTPAQYDLVINDNGNITQPVDRSGLPKAMVFVDPTLPADQYIVRCSNNVTGTTANNCGFTMTRLDVGDYVVGFPFQVSDRFFYVTTATGARAAGARPSGAGGVAVDMRSTIGNPGAHVDDTFYLVVF